MKPKEALVFYTNIRNKKCIIATPTRSGWQYPFRTFQQLTNLKLFKFFQRGKNRGLMVAVEGIIEFNRPIPSNTFIDSCDISQHLNYHTKTIGCKISVGRLSGNESHFELDFTAEWEDDSHLSEQLMKRSKDLAMESALMESLQNNPQLLIDLKKAFKITLNANDTNIISFDIIGSFPEGDKNRFLIDEILTQHNEDERQALKIADDRCESLPLYQFNEEDVSTIIRSWVLKDINYKKTMYKIMTALSKHKLSGSRLVSLGCDMRSVLQNEILQFMTKDTFDISVDYLENLIYNHETEIGAKSAPEIGQLINEIPLNNLLDRIEGRINDTKSITGQQFLNLCDKMDDRWIIEQTGWCTNQVLQIKSILYRQNTQQPQLILNEIERRLLDKNFATKIVTKFVKLISVLTEIRSIRVTCKRCKMY